jgi:hypothetical protein
MKTQLVRSLALLTILCGLTACPETTVPDGFGVGPVGLKAGDWQGDWSPVDEPGEVFEFQVADGPQGVLELHEKKPADERKKPEVFSLSLRHSGVKSGQGLCFAILKEKAKPGPGTLHLMRPAQKDVFVLWGVDHEAVTAALKAGELKGGLEAPDTDGIHYSLGADPVNYTVLLAPKFWKWTEPTVMVRRAAH